ncbi:MAG: Fpg/Nei family DNA glycosylase [Egibacteraceae bacterium]
MAEGDTIYRTARVLRAALEGQTVTAVRTTVAQIRGLGPQRLVGQTVAEVESRGKHLLLWFAPSRLALHSHMMMSGSWHVYRTGQRWDSPERLARIALTVGAGESSDQAGRTAVCFGAPVCELLSTAQVTAHPVLTRLGPDALDETPDLAEARRRLDRLGNTAIGEALLDQRVIAGIGNVYKSEILFIHGVNPWTAVGELPEAAREALLDTAVRLLRANALKGSGARRTTTSGQRGERLHVYGRTGRACPACGTAIRSRAQGAHARRTYWCPRCQG